jgi:hypothetical protein
MECYLNDDLFMLVIQLFSILFFNAFLFSAADTDVV